MGDIRRFGEANGVAIEEITLRTTAGAEAKILTWGAVVRDLVVPAPSGPQRVVLGFERLEDYLAYSPHFGAVPGRFANRIGHGRFSLDGKAHDLSRNEGGITTLHGGLHGFGTVPWQLVAHDDRSVTLALRSPDGDQGFPGTLEARCVYTLIEPTTLRFELTATTDQPTVVNLTNHSYFNLDGSPDVLGHHMMIAADAITPTDADLIPTGEILAVEGTPFDFRASRTIGNTAGQAYDMNFVLSEPSEKGRLKLAARASSPKSGVTLSVYTDQPGVQFYDAAKLDCPVPGLGGARYGRHGAFCLETQLFPDAPNQPSFPSAVLRPGERYGNMTEFRFA